MGRQPHFHFYVSRPDGSWTDLADHLTFAQVDLGSITKYGETSGVDRAIREAEFELAHDRQMIPVWDCDIERDSEDIIGDSEDVIGDEDDDAALLINLLFNTDHQWLGSSFHPLDQRSIWNQFDGQYDPLLFSRRECIFEVAFTDIGEEPDESDYIQLFHGVLGDKIENIGSGSVRLWVRDKAKYLTDTYITTRKTYGSEGGTPLEDVIEAILIDNGWSSIAADLWVPTSPGWMVHEHDVEHMSVWDAIQAEVKPTGWFLGFLYNPNEGKFVLTLLEPPRTKTTPDFKLTIDDDIAVQTLDISDADIRNKIIVTWVDPDTGERKTEIAEDLASQAVFGVRPMQVEEDDTSLIDTQQEAKDFSQHMLWDLKDLRATTRVESRAIPELDIFAGVEVDDPRIFSEPQFFGVETLRHEFDMRGDQHRYRTHFIGSGHVIGGRSKWLEMESRPGAKPPLRPEDMVGGGKVMPKPVNVSARGIIRGVAVDVPAPPVNANRWKVTEVHLSTTQGFTPSESTLVAAGRETHFEITDDGNAPLVSGTKYYLVARYVDMRDDAGPFSDEVDADADIIQDVPYEMTHPGGVTRFDAVGAFLRDADDLENFYAARIAIGPASDGDFVPLEFERPPKVWVAPYRFQTYVPGASASPQAIEAFASNISASGFQVHAGLTELGGDPTPLPVDASFGSGNPWTSSLSGNNTRRIDIDIWLRACAWLAGRASCEVHQTYKIEYKEDSDPNWTEFGQFTESQFLMNESYIGILNPNAAQICKARTVNLSITNLDPGQYQVRVSFVSHQQTNVVGSSGGFSTARRVSTWTYYTDELLVQGEVIYIAIEGGAEDEPEPEEEP